MKGPPRPRKAYEVVHRFAVEELNVRVLAVGIYEIVWTFQIQIAEK
jgi:hypothetical protein